MGTIRSILPIKKWHGCKNRNKYLFGRYRLLDWRSRRKRIVGYYSLCVEEKKMEEDEYDTIQYKFLENQ